MMSVVAARLFVTVFWLWLSQQQVAAAGGRAALWLFEGGEPSGW
jgi:hypothetical protein